MIRVRAGCGRGVVSHPSALNRGAAQGRPGCGRPFVSAGRCGRGRGRCHTLSQSGPRPRGLGRAPIFPGPGRAAGGLGHRPGRNVSPPPLATFRSRTVVWGLEERGSAGSRPENRPRGGTSPPGSGRGCRNAANGLCRCRPLPTHGAQGESGGQAPGYRPARDAAAELRRHPRGRALRPLRPFRTVLAPAVRRTDGVADVTHPPSPHRRCRLWIRCGL